MKILWLCSWYPNKIKPFDGDFIQRHAQAVSLLHEVQVFHVVKDPDKMSETEMTETSINGNLTETIFYYKSRVTGIRFLDRTLSEKKLRKLYKDAIKWYLANTPGITLIHLHVAGNAGSIALWVKKHFNIPYILSEHWTGYLSTANPNLKDLPWYKRLTIKNVFSHASLVTFVSITLAESVKKYFRFPDYRIIPNVVNTAIFNPIVKTRNDRTRFIHVSTMTFQKNIDQLLKACSILKKEGIDFNLEVFVPSVEKLHDLILKYELQEVIEVHAEVPQNVLAESIKQADALVLYSHFETFGCVVIEANACGVPAILSDLPVFREYSIENKTALFVKPDDPEALAKTMKKFIENKLQFNKEEIATYTANKFNYSVVAEQFDQCYQIVINQANNNKQ